MGLSGSGRFLKFLVFFFNAIVFLAGVVMLGYGIYLLVGVKQTGGIISVALLTSITVVGFLLFLVGFLGCLGACCNNTCMLITFAVVVGLLLLAEIVCGALVLVNLNGFVEMFGDQLGELIHEYEDNTLPNDDSIEFLHIIQEELKCCGGRGPDDWKNRPQSCRDASTKKGCAQAMYNEFKDSTLVMSIIILVLALIQIGAIICASCLAKKVNE